MTDDKKKHDDKDRKKLSDEEMEDVAGGEWVNTVAKNLVITTTETSRLQKSEGGDGSVLN
jgi:hypothetical protein